jgi:hypothetical protein
VALLVLTWTIAPRPACAGWPSDSTTNVMLTTGPGSEYQPLLVPDGAAASGGKTGVLVAWYDHRNGASNVDSYAQHVFADGRVDPAWPAGGRAVCALAGNQQAEAFVSDGLGGALLFWSDNRTAGNGWDLYAQHVLASGALDPAWPAGGAPVSAVTGNQWKSVAVADGSGGAMVVWQDERSAGNWDIYANHVLANGAIDGLWPANGRVVCNATLFQYGPVAISDGAGGVIASWIDGRGSGDIYVQRMSASTGLPLWTTNGVPVCTLASGQSNPSLVPDGTGGVVVVWDDQRNVAVTNGDIYAQHVTSAGAVDPGWAVDGLAVCTSTQLQGASRAISDGLGGALIVFADWRYSGNAGLTATHVLAGGTVDPAWTLGGTTVSLSGGDQRVVSDGARGLLVCWSDSRAGSTDVYAQRILASGVADPRWTMEGMAVCAAALAQYWPVMLAVEDGDAILAWSDYRSNATYKVYAQRLSGFGVRGTSAPRIAAVRDVAADQGGKLHVLWEPSAGDVAALAAIEDYRLWRRVTIGATTYWEFLAQVPAKGASGYGFMATTVADSAYGSLPWNAFRVTAHLADGITFFPSALDSGYSLDNLAPMAPQQLVGDYVNGTTTLAWNAAPEPDVTAYRVYRGEAPDFAPGPTTLLAEVPGTTFADAAGSPRWYRVGAVDAHGNEGASALLAPAATTGAGPPGTPALLALSAPRPNPARGAAGFELALPAGAHVSLAIYDVGGRLVRGLLDAPLPAGTHPLAWDTADDRGAPVASGLYFVRLEVAGVRLVRRLAVLR